VDLYRLGHGPSMSVTYTKAVFLRGMAMVYMFAFASLYVQIPGEWKKMREILKITLGF
jgi:hypothetical protein